MQSWEGLFIKQFNFNSKNIRVYLTLAVLISHAAHQSWLWYDFNIWQPLCERHRETTQLSENLLLTITNSLIRKCPHRRSNRKPDSSNMAVIWGNEIYKSQPIWRVDLRFPRRKVVALKKKSLPRDEISIWSRSSKWLWYEPKNPHFTITLWPGSLLNQTQENNIQDARVNRSSFLFPRR